MPAAGRDFLTVSIVSVPGKRAVPPAYDLQVLRAPRRRRVLTADAAGKAVVEQTTRWKAAAGPAGQTETTGAARRVTRGKGQTAVPVIQRKNGWKTLVDDRFAALREVTGYLTADESGSGWG